MPAAHKPTAQSEPADRPAGLDVLAPLDADGYPPGNLMDVRTRQGRERRLGDHLRGDLVYQLDGGQAESCSGELGEQVGAASGDRLDVGDRRRLASRVGAGQGYVTAGNTAELGDDEPVGFPASAPITPPSHASRLERQFDNRKARGRGQKPVITSWPSQPSPP